MPYPQSMQIELVWGIRHTICLLGPQSVPANSAELVGRFGGCLSCCLAGGLGCCIAVALAVASDVAYHPLTYVRHADVRPARLRLSPTQGRGDRGRGGGDAGEAGCALHAARRGAFLISFSPQHLLHMYPSTFAAVDQNRTTCEANSMPYPPNLLTWTKQDDSGELSVEEFAKLGPAIGVGELDKKALEVCAVCVRV